MTEDAKKIWDASQKERQAHRVIELSSARTWEIDNDIKHLGFDCARYKFAAKMLENKKSVKLLELGSAYGMGTCFFAQIAKCSQIVGVDFDSSEVAYARKNFSNDTVSFVEDDFLGKDYRSYLHKGGGGGCL